MNGTIVPSGGALNKIVAPDNSSSVECVNNLGGIQMYSQRAIDITNNFNQGSY